MTYYLSHVHFLKRRKVASAAWRIQGVSYLTIYYGSSIVIVLADPRFSQLDKQWIGFLLDWTVSVIETFNQIDADMSVSQMAFI